MSEPKLPDVFQTIFDTMPGIPKPLCTCGAGDGNWLHLKGCPHPTDETPVYKSSICPLCNRPITAACNGGDCDK